MPSLNLAIARLINTNTNNNFAIWVVNPIYPSGSVHYDCLWPESLTQIWQEWQQMFAGHTHLDVSPQPTPKELSTIDVTSLPSGQINNYGGRLMQHLGVSLGQWLFTGPILNSLERSRGIAMGQDGRLRVRLNIRDPDLIALPWEIMQSQSGQPVISLSPNILFSRTTSDVDHLPPLRTDRDLRILLVLGKDENLHLEKEAAILQETLSSNNSSHMGAGYSPCKVDVLLQPTQEELIKRLETQTYNVFFYAGHGEPGADGGLLFLQRENKINGIELAQTLTRTSVKLAVFNACWGAQPASFNHQAIPHSSLAEVLIHHGVPAVLGMRDHIADNESLTFIQAFAEALRRRRPIDEAVMIARKQLLTQHRFNHPAWTLPVLYLHPEFDGELIRPIEDITLGPFPPGTSQLMARLRSHLPEGNTWSLGAGTYRIGRKLEENEIIITGDQSVSSYHANIFCRNAFSPTLNCTFHLEDRSTYGTLISTPDGWQRIHRETVILTSGMQLKFGNPNGEIFEFVIESDSCKN
jgi:CHAT domain/FHA domain